MNNFKSIAVTHKQFDINDIGKFHIDEKEWSSRLSLLKNNVGIDEIMFLSTCNRVEFLLNTKNQISKDFLEKFIFSVYPEIKAEDANKTISLACISCLYLRSNSLGFIKPLCNKRLIKVPVPVNGSSI